MNQIPVPSDEIYLIGGLHIGINSERRVVVMMILGVMCCLMAILTECRIELYTMDVI